MTGFSEAPPPRPPVARRDPTAVMGRRVVAALLDLAAAFVLAMIVAGRAVERVDGVSSGYCAQQQHLGTPCYQQGSTAYRLGGHGVLILYLVLGVYALLTLVVLQGELGATPGKLLVGLRVVDDSGHICGPARAAARGALLVVDGACALGLIVALATHPHRRLGDLVAHTAVVGRDDVGTPVEAPTSPAPHWDPAWEAWLRWDPDSGRWLRYDESSGEWRPAD